MVLKVMLLVILYHKSQKIHLQAKVGLEWGTRFSRSTIKLSSDVKLLRSAPFYKKLRTLSGLSVPGKETERVDGLIQSINNKPCIYNIGDIVILELIELGLNRVSYFQCNFTALFNRF